MKVLHVHFHRSAKTTDADPQGGGRWVTINGAHVFINSKGQPTKGPDGLVQAMQHHKKQAGYHQNNFAEKGFTNAESGHHMVAHSNHKSAGEWLEHAQRYMNEGNHEAANAAMGAAKAHSDAAQEAEAKLDAARQGREAKETGAPGIGQGAGKTEQVARRAAAKMTASPDDDDELVPMKMAGSGEEKTHAIPKPPAGTPGGPQKGRGPVDLDTQRGGLKANETKPGSSEKKAAVVQALRHAGKLPATKKTAPSQRKDFDTEAAQGIKATPRTQAPNRSRQHLDDWVKTKGIAPDKANQLYERNLAHAKKLFPKATEESNINAAVRMTKGDLQSYGDGAAEPRPQGVAGVVSDPNFYKMGGGGWHAAQGSSSAAMQHHGQLEASHRREALRSGISMEGREQHMAAAQHHANALVEAKARASGFPGHGYEEHAKKANELSRHLGMWDEDQ